MHVVYLKRAAHDLVWWRKYYESVFPEGRERAYQQFDKTIRLLCANPYLGRPVRRKGLREFGIPRMPFSLIYRIDGDELKIARVVDQRSRRSRTHLEDIDDEE